MHRRAFTCAGLPGRELQGDARARRDEQATARRLAASPCFVSRRSMKHLPIALAAFSLAVPVHADDLAEAADKALVEDTLAWDFVEGITTEVGPRQAGTEAEARGRAWALD